MADLEAAHRHCSRHRASIEASIEASSSCGGIYCLRVFPPLDIVEWVDKDRTAICPHCPVDSVIGDASGFPVTDPEFPKAMHKRWFLERSFRKDDAVMPPKWTAQQKLFPNQVGFTCPPFD